MTNPCAPAYGQISASVAVSSPTSVTCLLSGCSIGSIPSRRRDSRLALSSTTLCPRRWDVARPATCDRCRRLDRTNSEFSLQSNDLRPEPIAFVLELNDSLAEPAVLDQRLGRFSGVDEAG
jgi:hypothetical protein